jgi:hypothetical protein
LGRVFLDKLYQEYRRCLTPRHLIMACHNEFDRLQKGKQQTRSTEEDTSAASPPTDALASAWEKKRKSLFDKPHGIPFDQVMSLGLPWLAEMTGLPHDRSHDIPEGLGNVNLLFPSRSKTTKPLGISLCNQEPRSLWHRLDQLKKQWEAAKGRELGSLVVLRYEGEKTTDAAKERLNGLGTVGVRVVIVERQQLAELATFQHLMTKTQGGNIVIDGKPIEIEVFNDWVKAHLTSAVKEFLDVVFAPDGKKAAKPKVTAARI